MSHFSRYGRRMRLTLINTISAACFVCLAAVPFFDGNLLKNEVGYYTVTVNGVKVGSANSKQEAQTALAQARVDFSKDYEQVIYIDPQIEVTKENKAIATRMNEAELEKAIYDSLYSCVVEMDKQVAYTVRIDDYTVTLGSREDVITLLERVAAKYDSKNEFQIAMDLEDAASGTYGITVAKSEIKSTNNDIVAAAMNSVETPVSATEAESIADGLTSIGFEQNIVISETTADNLKIATVDQAYEEITKENAEKTIYTVEAGDTLSEIANNNGLTFLQLCELNEGMSEETIIVPGDAIVITVPKSEISVVTTKTMTYEEDYNADVQYVDNNEAYRGNNTVISEGTTGHRKVTAEVTYVNGVENGRTYTQETIMTESQPKIVSVGTLTPPTYLKPLYGGSFSSGYGYRWGTFHNAVDWSCSVGTPIMAAADGVVARASWYSGYGYCIDIRHTDGSMTRYAHLNSMNVSVGQRVSQSQVIAASGNTGNSTGPHLHFELWINGSTVNPLNYVNKY
ncbi:MAG: M23 family metallopeptidase [Eubacteriales bacterium]|nr:M23 family metallopeptidase [Eubacteriales bacterium]